MLAWQFRFLNDYMIFYKESKKMAYRLYQSVYGASDYLKIWKKFHTKQENSFLLVLCVFMAL